MLKKCLKYDLRASFKLWLILTIVALSLSVIGGLSLGGATAESELVLLPILFFFLGFPSLFSIAAYPVATVIILGVRCYRNFYTDEGYLTFTLPVSRRTHFHSKLISSAIYIAASAVVTVLSLGIVVLLSSIVGNGEIFLDAFILTDFAELFAGSGFHGAMVIILSLIIVLLLEVTALLWFYFCIIFGSTIAKRLKILAIILTAYIGEMIVMVSAYLLLFFGAITLVAVVDTFSERLMGPVGYAFAWVILLIIAAMIAMVGALFYRYCVSSLEKRLNLA